MRTYLPDMSSFLRYCVSRKDTAQLPSIRSLAV